MRESNGTPEFLATAYGGLVALVERVSAGDVAVLREEADAWRREDCRGSATLAKSAVLALRYSLADEGLREEAGAAKRMRALDTVEGILEPPEAARPGSDVRITEVALPEAMRRAAPQARGFRMGELQIIFEPMAGPQGVTNAHLSVSHPRRYPTFEELLRARNAPGGMTPNLWAWLPRPDLSKPAKKNIVHLYLAPPPELLG